MTRPGFEPQPLRPHPIANHYVLTAKPPPVNIVRDRNNANVKSESVTKNNFLSGYLVLFPNVQTREIVGNDQPKFA